MANPDAPFGLQPINHEAYSSGAVQTYVTAAGDSTALRVGDPVIITGTADSEGNPVVTRATAGDENAISGVVVGFEADYDNLALQYRLASTVRKVKVNIDPDTRYICRADGALAATDIGSNAAVVFGTPNNTWGKSGAGIDSSTIATTATEQLKIMNLHKVEGNAFGDFAVAEVKINNHNLVPGTAGV